MIVPPRLSLHEIAEVAHTHMQRLEEIASEEKHTFFVNVLIQAMIAFLTGCPKFDLKMRGYSFNS